MAAFTVKATYRSETRKFSFADPVFPSYDQLYSQVSTNRTLLASACIAYRSPAVVSGFPNIPLLLSIKASVRP